MEGVDRRIVIVVYDGFQLLDMAGPADVFALASLLVRGGGGGYRVELAAVHAGHVTAHNGVTVAVPSALADVGETGLGETDLGEDGAGEDAEDIDTLMVVGGFSTTDHLRDQHLLDGIRRLARRARRVTSVCSGALVLAEAGLLEGRRATTHWLFADQLRHRYPKVEVDADAIYVHDGRVWTSAGVTAGVDLSLALVAQDHGQEIARQVACGLVVYLHRPGGQSQFSTPVGVATPRCEPLRELQAYIDANLTDDLSVPALARRTGMSERHFSRVFTDQTGLSPGRYVERARADAARRLLETTDHPLDRVARESGLGRPETLYRVFRRAWRVSPGDYRRRFRIRTMAEES